MCCCSSTLAHVILIVDTSHYQEVINNIRVRLAVDKNFVILRGAEGD